MMKKWISLLLLLIFVNGFSQKVTLEEAQKSKDPKIIAGFIRANPDHPQTPELKSKIISIISENTNAIAKTKAETSVKSELKKSAKKDIEKTKNERAQKAAALLNHIFDDNPNKKEAFVHILNNSKCNLMVKISGNKSYSLDVPANNEKYILVDKGKYTLSTNVCDAEYSSIKEIKEDISILLKN